MEEQKQKSWFARNWLWVVPSGGCLIVIIVMIVGAGIFFTKMPDLISKTKPMQVGMTRALTNETLIDAIGEPIEVDRSREPEGEMSLKNSDGDFEMSFPLKGPDGEATLYIKAQKEDGGEWIYETLSVIVEDTQEVIDLKNEALDEDL